jgi:hypothetical protein
MEESERDSTDDWQLGPDERPPSVQELLARIDGAVASARASEGAVEVVGEAAIKAAERARLAVEQAHTAAEAAHRSAELAERASAMLPHSGNGSSHGALVEDERMRNFTLRADRLVARLRAL